MNIFKKKKLTFFKAYEWSNLEQLFAAWNFFKRKVESLNGKTIDVKI